MEKQEQYFVCPYCGRKKNILELNYNSELGNFQPTNDKFGDFRDVCDYKHIKFKYKKYEIPICEDCLIIHQESSTKANIAALILFVPLAVYLLYYVNKTDGGLGDFIILTGLVGVVCLGIRLIIKIILINRQDIHYHAHNNLSNVSPDELFTSEDPITQELLNATKPKVETWVDTWEKENVELQKAKEEWDRHHKTIKVDLGNGQVQYISKYLSDSEIELMEKEKGSVDFSKINKFEEGASVDYSDDDFEGHFV